MSTTPPCLKRRGVRGPSRTWQPAWKGWPREDRRARRVVRRRRPGSACQLLAGPPATAPRRLDGPLGADARWARFVRRAGFATRARVATRRRNAVTGCAVQSRLATQL